MRSGPDIDWSAFPETAATEFFKARCRAAADPTQRPPEDLGSPHATGWAIARALAGELCQGLGNRVDPATFLTLEAEPWEGHRPVRVPDPLRREEFLAVIREVIPEALAEGWTARRAASELGTRTGDWARDWERDVGNELGSALNYGAVIDAIRWDGLEARFALVGPCCVWCDAITMAPDGTPVIFDVVTLVANGVNMGREPHEWLPTIHPIHDHCMCWLTVVPTGMTFSKDRRLVRDPGGQ